MAGALGTLATLGKETLTRWTENRAGTLAAALAYYALFSLAPLVLIAAAVGGLVFGRQAAEGQLHAHLAGMMGDAGARAVQRLVANLEQQRSGGIVATLVGLATLLFAASRAFAQLQGAMNIIWEAKPPTTRGIVEFLRVRFLSFSMVLGIGLLLLVALILAALGGYLGALLPGAAAVGQGLNTLVSLVVATGLFAMIYKILPDTEVAWRDVWLGALVTSLLFTIGKLAIGFYLGKVSVASSYGAAGSVVILLLWVHYSAMLLYLGAEFTHVYSIRHGSRRAAT